MLILLGHIKPCHGQTLGQLTATRYTYSVTEEYGPNYTKHNYQLPSGIQLHYRTPDGKARMERYDGNGKLLALRLRAGDTTTDLTPASKTGTQLYGVKEAAVPAPGPGDHSTSLLGMGCVVHTPDAHTTTFNLKPPLRPITYERSFSLTTCTDPADGSTFRAGWVIVMPNHTTTVTITVPPTHNVLANQSAFQVPADYRIK